MRTPEVESVVVMSRKTDVFVIGGGPAGLATAIAARQKGFSVTLADGAEPPLDKACGEGILPETQLALKKSGVELPANLGFRFRGIQFVQNEIRVAADFTQSYGLGIRRPVLHQFLLEKAEKCGVHLLWKTPVLGILPEGVQLRGRFVPARWILGADGSGSRVRKWAGLDAASLRTYRYATRRHYRLRPWSEYTEVHWGVNAQAYLTPVSPDEMCIVALAEKPEHADFNRLFEDLPQLKAKLTGAELVTRERGALTSMHILRRVSRGNVVLVGDASGGVDAITGDGLLLAFQQASALADALATNNLAMYEKAHHQLARRPLCMGKLMLHFGKNPLLRTRVMKVLAKNPDLFQRLLSIHVGTAAHHEILSAGAQLSWQFLTA